MLFDVCGDTTGFRVATRLNMAHNKEITQF